MGNFPLAECNEISGKCFPPTPPGVGRVTERRAVAVVASAITDLPIHLPTLRFQFCRLFKCNVQLCNFVSVPSFEGYLMCTFFKNLE